MVTLNSQFSRQGSDCQLVWRQGWWKNWAIRALVPGFSFSYLSPSKKFTLYLPWQLTHAPKKRTKRLDFLELDSLTVPHADLRAPHSAWNQETVEAQLPRQRPNTALRPAPICMGALWTHRRITVIRDFRDLGLKANPCALCSISLQLYFFAGREFLKLSVTPEHWGLTPFTFLFHHQQPPKTQQ